MMLNARIPYLVTSQRKHEWNRVFTPTLGLGGIYVREDVGGSALSRLDAAQPRFDPTRARAVFIATEGASPLLPRSERPTQNTRPSRLR